MNVINRIRAIIRAEEQRQQREGRLGCFHCGKKALPVDCRICNQPVRCGECDKPCCERCTLSDVCKECER